MSPSAHRDAIAELDRDIRELKAEIERLHSVRGWHASKIEDSGEGRGVELATVSAEDEKVSLDGLKQHEAILWTLNKAGRPMKPSEIVDRLFLCGYKQDRPRQSMLNGVYNTMKRRGDMFCRTEDARWRALDSQKPVLITLTSQNTKVVPADT